VSWLTYADRLMEFPTALLGVALGVVLLPQLSAAQARDDTQSYSDMLDWGLRMLMLLALPCAVALIVFPKALVAVLFHYGQFQPQDVTQTTRALMCYGVGLMGLVGVKVLAPGFYARHDIRTPVRIAVVVLVATQAMNLVLVPQFGHAGRHKHRLLHHAEGFAGVIVDVEIHDARCDPVMHIIAFRDARMLPRACRVKHDAFGPVDHQPAMCTRIRPIVDHGEQRDRRRPLMHVSRGGHPVVWCPDWFSPASGKRQKGAEGKDGTQHDLGPISLCNPGLTGS
jgi:hypothetical protein